MIDLRAARNDPEGFRAALARKGAAELFDNLDIPIAGYNEGQSVLTRIPTVEVIYSPRDFQ